MAEIITKSARETADAARSLAKKLTAGSVIAFSGDMGAGKTCFCRGICDGLGFSGDVSSPTFAIVNVYEGGVLPIYHFDMYRISGWEDLYTTGYFDYLDRSDGVILVEWSENIDAALPDNAIRVDIEKTGGDCRRICVTGGNIL